MNLSMWILLDELKDFDTEADITKGEMNIEMMQLTAGELPERLEDRYVYVVKREGSYFLLNGSDRIVVHGMQGPVIINRLLQIFEDYRKWSERLNAATKLEAPLQKVLDIAHEKFGCPMFFGNVDLHIMAITRQYTDAEVYDGWEEVVRKCTIPYSLIEHLKSLGAEAVNDDAPQGIEPVWKGMRFAHQIRTNCYFKNAVWGHLYLYWKEEDVSPAVLQKAAYVAAIYENMIEEHEADMRPQYHLYSWLIEVINGEKVTVDPIISIYQDHHWKHADPLVLFKVEKGAEDYWDEFLFYWLCDTITRVTEQAVFPMESAVIVIAPADPETVDRTAEKISRVISYNHFTCGISLPFVGMSHLRGAYLQADAAIRMAPDSGGKVHRYRDCLLEGMIRQYGSAVGQDWKQMIIPELTALHQGDQKGRTKDLYSTIREYLKNNCSISETAKALQVHRNTLVYRLKKIEEELKMDLDQEKCRTYLMNCILLLDGMSYE